MTCMTVMQIQSWVTMWPWMNDRPTILERRWGLYKNKKRKKISQIVCGNGIYFQCETGQNRLKRPFMISLVVVVTRHKNALLKGPDLVWHAKTWIVWVVIGCWLVGRNSIVTMIFWQWTGIWISGIVIVRLNMNLNQTLPVSTVKEYSPLPYRRNT
jgi:hypothetical protein